MHKITNLWKFELNWSSKLRDNNERKKKHPCHTKLCAFRWLISRPQFLNLRSRNQIRGKLLFSRKLCHFRGSRFSQCLLPSTSFLLIIILSNNQKCPLPLRMISTETLMSFVAKLYDWFFLPGWLGFVFSASTGILPVSPPGCDPACHVSTGTEQRPGNNGRMIAFQIH